jgi:hypothetical protein
MSTDPSGVIYLEVDEDITSAIDKLTKAAGSRVQVVTAKRSTLFQSVINLKLLHKAAKDANKSLVLVTSDRVATSLAGRLGVAVASQVGEAAKVPTAASAAAAMVADDEIDGGAVGTPEPPTGVAANPLASAEPEPPTPSEPTPPSSPSKTTKARGKRVPNIGKMQKRLLWGLAAVAVIAVLFGLNYFLSSASVNLYAKASQVNASFSFTADPTVTQSDPSSGVLTAQQLSLTKTLSAPVTATGTQDDGSKASGTMTINNCYGPSAVTIPAGTQFTAPDGNVFVSTGDVTVPGDSQNPGHNSFKPGTASVGVQAVANGTTYNESSTTYAVSGQPAGGCSGDPTGISGQGGQMQGGVTKIDKVITQGDVNTAQASALAGDKAASISAVEAKASSSQTVLTASAIQSPGSASANPSVGSEAASGTVTIQVTYTVLAVQKSDLSKLAQTQESQQLGAQSQIYDDGSGNLQFTALSQVQSSGAQKFKAAATAYAGTKIDTTGLATQLKGQKYSDAVQTASQVPGVTKATVTMSPSWESNLPQITGHIHVQIKVSNPSGS